MIEWRCIPRKLTAARPEPFQASVARRDQPGKRGDERVIEETIKAVTDAEAQADQIQADARQKAAAITDAAEKKAAQILADTKSRVKAAAETSNRQAQTKGQEMLEEVRRTSAIEVEKMKADARARMPEAVEEVIRCVLSDSR